MQKFLIFLSVTIGSIIGGYIPTLFGADLLSYSSILFSGLGAILGIIIGFKLSS